MKRVKIMRGSDRYLHWDNILIMFISEKKERRGGTEKFPHKIIIKNKDKTGAQFSRGDLKYNKRLFQNLVNEYAKKNIPDATIPWIKIKIEALLNLLKDFRVRTRTRSVM